MANENNPVSGRRWFLSVAVGGALLAVAAGAQAMLAGRRKLPVSREEVAEFTRHFAVLLDSSGLSLVDIVDTLAEKQDNPEFRALLRQINSELEQGGTLSRAMAKYPAVFNAAYVAAIQRGENEGELEVAVQRLSEQSR